MLLKRLTLRNYRVYEDFLDLELPSGLVGIYGVNGSGKSTLLEAILFALWGKARTPKEEIRTAGVGGDCVVELTFEHEGHLYVVRRSLSGVNLAAKAEVHCDGLAMAEGVRDAGRYLHQVLGMDDAAFRASVFAEQKQLAAFSDRSPAQRRDLVLQLLGITPLDAAREAARRDAREARQSHERLRGMLADLEQLQLRADDAAALAEAALVVADTEEQAATAAERKATEAREAFARYDRLRQEYDGLVIEGRAAKEQLDSDLRTRDLLSAERADLEAAALTLVTVLPQADGLEVAQRRLELVSALARAEDAAAAVVVPPPPPLPDHAALSAAREAIDAAQAAASGAAGQVDALKAEVSRAREQAARSAQLSGSADCPLCGQALGDAFEQVQAHRAAEVHDAEARLSRASVTRTETAAALAAARARFDDHQRDSDRLASATLEWERAASRLAAAEDALRVAQDVVSDIDLEALARELSAAIPCPARELVKALRADTDGRRSAAATVARLNGRLERRPTVEAHLELARERVAESEHRVAVLRDKVRLLGFDRAALVAASDLATSAADTALHAARQAREARVTATRAAAQAESEARRLDDARAQHATLAALADDSRHLGRLAELLNAFRNTVVATVGPRLAVQAAELFAELTDHEYDYLQVDPDTYELQICDGGITFGLDRFSGSEVDLANLALRVAISEHVRFQSGGTVGLLVLDEVFGPLDQDRKARMLLALERLRGRFRQVLVVTHDTDIKEQLPSAIEVQKLPGRRARARLLEA
ncbi:MAG: AAA family ATPase [Acidimicrobiales bacterium]